MLILMFAAPLALSVAHANATDDAKCNGDDAAVREVVAGFSDAVIVSHTADFNATAPAAK
jgi:hypothetical protein